MRIGSQEWYEAHPDAPTPGEAEEDLAFEREARRRGWRPTRTTGSFAEALEQAWQNAQEANRD